MQVLLLCAPERHDASSSRDRFTQLPTLAGPNFRM
jgi:hypothetical protein